MAEPIAAGAPGREALDSVASAHPMSVEVVFAGLQQLFRTTLHLPAGTTVASAAAAARSIEGWPEFGANPTCAGIFSRRVEPDDVLQDGDRLEFYRPLSADPKDARRRRATTNKPAKRA